MYYFSDHFIRQTSAHIWWLCLMKICSCEHASSKATPDSRSSAAKILGCTTRVTDWIQENAHFCCQNDLWDREKTDCKAHGLGSVQDFFTSWPWNPTVGMLAAKQHQIVGAVLQKFLVALLGLRTEYKKTPIFVAKMICGTGKRLTVRRTG